MGGTENKMKLEQRVLEILTQVKIYHNNAWVDVAVLEIMEIINRNKDKNIYSMEEYQQKYFPTRIGKDCPYCGKKITSQTQEY